MQWKALGVGVALVAASAQAGACPADPEAVEQRLTVLADAFDDQIHALDIWSWSWAALYGAGGIAQLSIAATLRHDNPSREDLFFGGIASVIGSISAYVIPLKFTTPMRRLRKQWSDPDRCALLARAEAMRTRGEHEQNLGKSWLGQIGNVLFNAGLALTLGLAFGHWKAGLISGGIGIIIGEINLLSQPTNLWRVAEPPPVRLVPIVGPDMQGAGLVVRF
jgi:hypothetical protein